MKMKNAGPLIATLVMTLILSTAIANAAAPNPGKGRIFPPPMLDGTRIDLKDGPITIPTDSPVYVIHGWDLDNWKTRTKEDRRDFLENYTFELYINGERVELRSWKHYYADQDLMKLGFSVEFNAGHFEPGTYRFRGVWRPDGAKETTVVKFHAP